MRYIAPLTLSEVEDLREIMRNPINWRESQRAHMLLLSYDGYTIQEIMNIYQVSRDTVSRCFDRWERDRLAGLLDNPRSGRPRSLTPSEETKAISILKENPRSIKMAQQKLSEQTGKQVSEWTLKRTAKRKGYSWKRMRKVVSKKPNEVAKLEAQLELAELEQKAEEGLIDVVYQDEAGFNLTPVVPYAWTPIGETLEIPSAKSKQLNVLGFLRNKEQFTSYVFEGNVNSDVFIACVDNFVQTLTKTTVLVLDQASWHTSAKVLAKISEWRQAGLVIKYLPPYCPHLNKTETIWRFTKYDWLPLSAYSSFQNLYNELCDTLANIGSKFRITFA